MRYLRRIDWPFWGGLAFGLAMAIFERYTFIRDAQAQGLIPVTSSTTFMINVFVYGGAAWLILWVVRWAYRRWWKR